MEREGRRAKEMSRSTFCRWPAVIYQLQRGKKREVQMSNAWHWDGSSQAEVAAPKLR